MTHWHYGYMRSSSPTDPRFLAKVNKSGECWLWTAATDDDGYGRFWFNGRMVQAHRYAYERYVGVIPDGVGLDHKCRVRHCVNPAHLRPGGQVENMQNTDLRADNKSGHRGVSWNTRLGKWHARVKHSGKLHHVGYFEDPEAAGRAAKDKRIELFTHNETDKK